MPDRRVLLIIGGGVAATKALEAARLLLKAGVGVTPILTRAATHFVTPLTVGALCGEPARVELFDLEGEGRMGHIELSRSADLILVAPATADLMAKAAIGLADDLASTALLASDKPILMAPAMNVRMWEHAATKANRATLEARGVHFVGPEDGEMACGEFGPGRLSEPPRILDAVQALLEAGERPLSGKKALVTAGPTVEPLDPVRVLTNRSSGKQGYAVAAALARLGAEVTLVSGPTALDAPFGVRRVPVETARQMLQACEAALPVDVAVCVAAVADWRPAEAAQEKIKKGQGQPTVSLAENPDILAALAKAGPRRPAVVVGFAAETTDMEVNARAKLKRKGCDLIVANDVSAGQVVGADQTSVLVVGASGSETWPSVSKAEVARRLADLIHQALDA